MFLRFRLSTFSLVGCLCSEGRGEERAVSGIVSSVCIVGCVFAGIDGGMCSGSKIGLSSRSF